MGNMTTNPNKSNLTDMSFDLDGSRRCAAHSELAQIAEQARESHYRMVTFRLTLAHHHHGKAVDLRQIAQQFGLEVLDLAMAFHLGEGSAMAIVAIADTLGVTPDWIIGFGDDPAWYIDRVMQFPLPRILGWVLERTRLDQAFVDQKGPHAEADGGELERLKARMLEAQSHGATFRLTLAHAHGSHPVDLFTLAQRSGVDHLDLSLAFHLGEGSAMAIGAVAKLLGVDPRWILRANVDPEWYSTWVRRIMLPKNRGWQSERRRLVRGSEIQTNN